MATVTVREVRASLADVLNRAAYGGERVVIRRNGKPVAALISVEDLQLLEKLEDWADVQDAKEALAEGDELIPFEDVIKERRGK